MERGRKWRAVHWKQRCRDEKVFFYVCLFVFIELLVKTRATTFSRFDKGGEGMCLVEYQGQKLLSPWTKESVTECVASHCVGSSTGFPRPPGANNGPLKRRSAHHKPSTGREKLQVDPVSNATTTTTTTGAVITVICPLHLLLHLLPP